jgi:guanylate kinase
MDEFILLAICSPSGAGKSTLTQHLLTELPELTFSVSHTTRAPRGEEVYGEHYYFVDRQAFEAMIDVGSFAEWAVVHDNLYGTSLDELQRARDAGKRGIVFDIDHQGARQLRARLPDAVSVFVLPPSMEELRRRLVGRGTDHNDVIERRLAKARDEISHYGFFDYLIVNDDLENAKRTILAIALAELARCARVACAAEELLKP